VIDLLENKGLNNTTLVVLCLILELYMILDKPEAKGSDKNWCSSSPPNHETTFCLSCLKDQNNLLSTKHRTR
jgi:hypothetical protein